MTEKELSRRRVMQLGLGAAATAGLVSATSSTWAQSSEDSAVDLESGVSRGPAHLHTSVSNAYLFLDQMMDAYAQGSTVRMCQSYSDQIAGGTFLSTAFVYDNALLAACLSRTRKRR